jgi:hypothetical protein
MISSSLDIVVAIDLVVCPNVVSLEISLSTYAVKALKP